MVGIDIAQFMVIACDLNTSDIDVPVCKNLEVSMNIKIDLFRTILFSCCCYMNWLFPAPKE